MRLLASLLLSLLIASTASAVTMAWTPIGNPGNACDPQPDGLGGTGCYGGVGYAYNIGTYEVTNAQYVEFLNAKAASDPLGLYNTDAGLLSFGGITRTGSNGSYTYSAIVGDENKPVNFVNFYDALRFANWMNNGQGNGDTESGAYTLLGGTPIPSNGGTVTRNAGATIVLTNENEWYKAAYYDAITQTYFDYPTSSNTAPTCAFPTATPNRANCGDPGGPRVLDTTPVGSYTGSGSPYGTVDQGGNVSEWNEVITFGSSRGFRGGGFANISSGLNAAARGGGPATGEGENGGFRLAMIPEPGTGLLVIAGLLCLAGSRRMNE